MLLHNHIGGTHTGLPWLGDRITYCRDAAMADLAEHPWWWQRQRLHLAFPSPSQALRISSVFSSSNGLRDA
ncbi:unnamed protein product [Urochloa humidicola]